MNRPKPESSPVAAAPSAATPPADAAAGRVFGILPTYRRQALLLDTLQKTMQQVRPPDCLVVVDNESSPQTRTIVEEFHKGWPELRLIFLDAGENRGSAGGWALGMAEALQVAQDNDWILTLDDDDPPMSETELSDMYRFGESQRAEVEKLGAVGIVGARFNWRTGYLVRPQDDELVGPVEVDYVGSGHCAMYSAAMMKDLGPFRADLFFGHTEVEYCLRLKRSGYRVIANGDLWRKRRADAGRLGVQLRPDRRCVIKWQKYYVTRNYIFTMRQAGKTNLALKRALIQTVVKPLYTLPSSPRRAWRGFRLAWRASVDGFRGRMGRTLEPFEFKP